MLHRSAKRSGLIEVIDRCPDAVAQHPDIRFGVDEHGRWRRPQDSGSCRTFVQGGLMALYTRLWLGITPPEGTDPGYVCVVGEEYHGQIRAVQRPLYVLDEFSSPILPRLFLGAAELKDLYCADRVFYDPHNDRFAADLQRSKWGLCSYPQDEEWPEHELKAIHPHYRDRECIASPGEPPYLPDDDWARILIDALWTEDMLGHHALCAQFHDSAYRTPARAAALVIMAMQAYDWSDRLQQVVEYDGYEHPEEAEARERTELEGANALTASLLYATGDESTRAALSRRRFQVYEPEGAEEIRRRSLVEEDVQWVA